MAHLFCNKKYHEEAKSKMEEGATEEVPVPEIKDAEEKTNMMATFLKEVLHFDQV